MAMENEKNKNCTKIHGPQEKDTIVLKFYFNSGFFSSPKL
jgi:hypothetical protein